MKRTTQHQSKRTGKIRTTKITIKSTPRPTQQQPTDTVMTRFWIGLTIFLILTTGAVISSPSDFYETVKQTFFQ